MVFITKEKLRLPGMSADGVLNFLLGDLQVEVQFRTREEALEGLQKVDALWPFRVWFLLTPRVF